MALLLKDMSCLAMDIGSCAIARPFEIKVWIETGKYDAGVSGFLTSDGWTSIESENFLRRQEDGVNYLALYCRHFATGSSYSRLLFSSSSRAVRRVPSSFQELDGRFLG